MRSRRRAAVPFEIAYGGSDVGAGEIRVTLSGIASGESGSTASPGSGLGMSFVTEAARPAGAARLHISGGKPTKGKLVLAIYTLPK